MTIENARINETTADLDRSIVADSEMNSVTQDSFALIVGEAGTSRGGYRYLGKDDSSSRCRFDRIELRP